MPRLTVYICVHGLHHGHVMNFCMLALPPHGSMTMHFHHADAIVQPLHLSSCFEHACTSPVIMALLEVCVGLEFAPDAIPAARHWRPMTEMQQEPAIDGSPVIYLDAPCGGPERLLGGFHALNRTTQGLPDNMLEYRCRHGTRAVVRPAPERNVLVLGVTVKPKAGNVICRFTFLFTGALACESSHDHGNSIKVSAMAKMLKRGMLREEAAGVTNMTEIKLMLKGTKELKGTDDLWRNTFGKTRFAPARRLRVKTNPRDDGGYLMC